jgi:6,7-dimethyl-8-ribityllumazine synthase
MLNIAIVRSSYYDNLVSSMEKSAKDVLLESGIPEENIIVVKVPGSFEISLVCQKIAKEGKVDGIIALGIIINGQTHHAEEIARACTDGLMQTQLATGIPIAHEVLYVDSKKHAEDRSIGEKNRGGEAGRTLLKMISIIQ